MNRVIVILVLFLLIGLLLAGVFWYGLREGRQAAQSGQPEVSSQLVFERITDRYFLVTKTIFADSRAEINTPEKGDWRDLFVGQEITVRGLVRVDVGVDMQELAESDIRIDRPSRTIRVDLPEAEILDTSLKGELYLDEDKAILDKLQGLFQDTRNDDYNRAMELLLANARQEVNNDADIFREARTDSVRLVELILSGLPGEYQVVVE